MEGLLTDLGVPMNGDELRRVVERQGWENPAFKFRKGPGRKRRKAKPGGWRDDLTPEQVKTVEDSCQPVLEAFYADSES
jgi:hypothetical protein